MKLLAYTSPARGHLYPLVPIAQAGAGRGHAFAVRTLASELAQLRALGIECAAIDSALEHTPLRDWRARSQPGAVRSVVRTLLARAPHEARDLARAIEQHDPAALLIDINCWGAAVAAEASARPWAMYCPFPLPLSSRETPFYGPGLAPSHRALARARDTLASRLAAALADRAVAPRLNALRAQCGLAPLAHFNDLFARPALLLACTAEGFEYPRSDWPANVRLVGPLSWAPPEPEPSWLAGMGEPLVLVTCSSERQHDERLLRVALAALPAAGISVLATSAAHDPTGFAAPAGSRVLRFLSHDLALERATCVVCHGGMGITQRALGAGVPVVAVPFGRDQLEVARRLEVAAAGVRVRPRDLDPSRLLRAVIDAQALRPGARRVRRAFAAAGGAEAAVAAIEAIADPAARAAA